MVKNDSFKEIWDKLKSCKNILLSLHPAPDGDSLGSCAAMKYVLERDLKIKVTLISHDDLDETLMSLPYSKEVRFGKDIGDYDIKRYDAMIFLDSGSMLKDSIDKGIIPKDVFTIDLDHHEIDDCMASMCYIDDSQISTCSLLMQFFKSVGVKFDKELSTRLLLGLCTDTGFFMHNSNKALLEASFLVSNGGDYQSIVYSIQKNVPFKLKKYYALLIDSFKIVKINDINVGYSILPYKDVTKLSLNKAEVRFGISQLLDIKGCDMVFTLIDQKSYIKGSFRSKSGIDVARLAKLLGGGGHKAAAAFSFPDVSLKDAEKKTLSLLRKNL